LLKKNNRFTKGILYTSWPCYLIVVKYTLYLVMGDCHFTKAMQYNEGVKRITMGIVLWIMKSLLFIAGTFYF